MLFSFEQGSSVKLNAVYVNKDTVLCPWSPGLSGSVDLKVSNDGVKVSGRLQLVVYNSLCQVCTLTQCSPRVRQQRACLMAMSSAIANTELFL